MKRKLVSNENPIVFLSGVYPEYTQEGIAVDCGHIILIKRGEATLIINSQVIKQELGNVTILFPGDVVMVKNHSNDFELEYLVFTENLMYDVFGQLDLKLTSLETIRGFSSTEFSHITKSIFSILHTFITLGKDKESYDVIMLQLRSFYIIYQSYIVSLGYSSYKNKNHKDKLFARFIKELSTQFNKNRNASYYAEKLCITPKYLSNIVNFKTNKSTKTYISEYTIMHIRLALKSSDLSISQIAWDFNFSSVSFFCDFFKRYTGKTPMEYREMP